MNPPYHRKKKKKEWNEYIVPNTRITKTLPSFVNRRLPVTASSEKTKNTVPRYRNTPRYKPVITQRTASVDNCGFIEEKDNMHGNKQWIFHFKQCVKRSLSDDMEIV